ncbi:MAG: hypothetical protein ACOCYQ_04520, partial [Alkalispirochaeta sp.]
AGVILRWIEEHKQYDPAAIVDDLGGSRVSEWVNLGGQLVPEADVTALRREIAAGTIDSWDAVHHRYDELAARYPDDLAAHAFAVARELLGDRSSEGELDRDDLKGFLSGAITIQEMIRDRVYQSRRKDYENPFRVATYMSTDEMEAAIGTIDDNSFVTRVAEETEIYRRRIEGVLRRLEG